ncbi:hypothetical protein QF038_000876 [Pseudarthrobacter sp. W1I19]|uniref:hypothetical protein n=1 Tax=Pseudarthrobacter sp. W1I19 TaxID=3042288 RepID=UPI00277E9097|nr:hypothetical protein [Pseudarthrobacter sp. W1I19]MDQ0922368.1 hypothetical protein [Pseudarthrobacter sp. W1I19]
MTTAGHRTAVRAAAALSAAAGLLLAGTGPSFAHGSVDPSSPAAGGYSQLTFRVPNESATAEPAGLSATTEVSPAADNTLGAAGLGAGVLGLALGTAALVRTRAPRKPQSSGIQPGTRRRPL